VLKTLLYLCHDVISTFFRATTDIGKRQDAFFRTCNCVLKHIYGVYSILEAGTSSVSMPFLLIPNCAFQIYIGASNSSLKALTAAQSRNNLD
jgi:hypothetical protein